MRNWRLFSKGTSFTLFLFLQICKCEVTLRVLIRPPFVTLECLIINAIEKTSVIMMCPNDVMCFQNCTPLCDRNCSTNAIKCSTSNVGTGFKYTYTFDSTNRRNQGEWTCHFGNQQSSTVIFFNDTKPETTVPSLKSTIASRVITTPKIFYNWKSASSRMVTKALKEQPSVNYSYVIVLIVLFVLSLCLNIALIIRNVKYNSMSKKSKLIPDDKRRSCIKYFCIKLFCVEDLFKESSRKPVNKTSLPRQFSNNIYELTPSTHLPPAIVLDNYAFIGTPTNQRLYNHNFLNRSMSFPSQPVEHVFSGAIRPKTLFPKSQSRSKVHQMLSRQDSSNPMIYDDVAEQSICNQPQNYFNKMHASHRPSQYMSTCTSLDGAIPATGMSMNNLAATGYRLLNGAASNEDQLDEESILKDAINSRVELSKEMIHQADTLLKKADSLLNDKDQQQQISSSHNDFFLDQQSINV